jgi:hypothetical protein
VQRRPRKRIGERAVIEFANDEQAERILVHPKPAPDDFGFLVPIQHGNGQMFRVSQKFGEGARSENIAKVVWT